MIGRPTVFVVGAGASSEVKLPLGQRLTKDIAGALKLGTANERNAAEPMRITLSVVAKRVEPFKGKQDELFGKAHAMSKALATASSIEVFIDNHAANETTRVEFEFVIGDFFSVRQTNCCLSTSIAIRFNFDSIVLGG